MHKATCCLKPNTTFINNRLLRLPEGRRNIYT
jgi:hypothetical protein